MVLRELLEERSEVTQRLAEQTTDAKFRQLPMQLQEGQQAGEIRPDSADDHVDRRGGVPVPGAPADAPSARSGLYRRPGALHGRVDGAGGGGRVDSVNRGAMIVRLES